MCPVQLALSLCLSVPGLGTELAQPSLTDPVGNWREMHWDWDQLHDRYRQSRKLWSIESHLGDFTAGMVLGDTRNLARIFDREETLYLYSNYENFTFLVTPDSAGLAYRWQFR
jgi:hypothetical protein